MRRRVVRTINIGRVLVMVASLSLCVCVAVFGLLLFKGSNKNFRIVSSQYYVVASARYDTYSQAQTEGEPLQQSGGAGYVWTQADGFYLAVSVYKKKADAEAVAARISGASVQPVALGAVEFEFDDDALLATEYAAFFYEPLDLFDSLYRIGTDFMSKNTSESHALLAIAALKTRAYAQRARLDSYATLPHHASLERMYDAVIRSLVELAAFSVSQNLSANIQYALCGIVEPNATCRAEINFSL